MTVRSGTAVLALAAGAALGAAGCSCCGTPAEAPAAAPAAAGEIRSVKPSKDYPIKKCVVSGEGLDEMGEPVAILYDGVEVQFCCPNCIQEFRKDPNRYIGILEEAMAGKGR